MPAIQTPAPPPPPFKRLVVFVPYPGRTVAEGERRSLRSTLAWQAKPV